MRYLLIFILALAVGTSSFNKSANLALTKTFSASNSGQFENNIFDGVEGLQPDENNQIYSQKTVSQIQNFEQSQNLKKDLGESEIEGKLRVSACGGDNNANSDNNGGCVCKSGWGQKNGAGPCVACNTIDLFYIGDEKGGCRCRSGCKFAADKCRACNYFDVNSKADAEGVCQCNTNFVNDTQKTKLCKPCNYFDVFFQPDGQGRCDCINGYTKNNLGKCIVCQLFKANTVGNKARGCMCKNGFKNVSDTCVSCTSLHGKATGDNKGGCVCVDGFELVGDTCTKCDLNDKYRQGDGKGGCECIDKFQPINGKCTDMCPTFDPKSIYSDLEADCVCIPHFKNGTERCESACKDKDLNSVYDEVKKECACILLFEKDLSGKCQDTCPSKDQHSEYHSVSGECQCLPNFSNQSNTCKHKCYQKPFSRPIQDDSPLCQCVEGYFLQGSSCLKCSDKFDNMTDDGAGGCRCLDGYGQIDGICKLCSDSDPKAKGDGKKSCVCSAGLTFSLSSKKCQDQCFALDSKSFYDQQSGRCACTFYHKNISGTCQDHCLQFPNKVGDGRGNCVCSPGYFLMTDGTCKKCSDLFPNTVLNGTTGSCICAPGLGLIKGECQNCQLDDQNSSSGQYSQCACQPGWKKSPVTGKCVDRCTLEDPNSEYSLLKDECVCKQFFAMNSRKCLDHCFLQTNKTGDGTGTAPCSCIQNYAPSLTDPTQCRLCSQIYPNMTGSSVNQCKCKSGYFESKIRKGCFYCHDIHFRLYPDFTENKCKCATNFYYDELKQECIDNCRSLITNSVFDRITGKCICKPGYFDAGSSCENFCTAGRFPNQNGYCICANGSIFSQLDNACIDCKTFFSDDNLIGDGNGGCTCQAGLAFFSGTCIASCQNYLGQYSMTVNGICYCLPYHRTFDRYLQCQPDCLGMYSQNSQYDDAEKTCFCSLGYKYNQTQKKCLPICSDERQTLGGLGVCECKPGYTGSPPFCYDSCSAENQKEITNGMVGSCQCKPGYYRKLGRCTSCNDEFGNTTDDGTGQYCKCLNNYWTPSSWPNLHCTRCSQYLPNSQTKYQDQTTCYCKAGYKFKEVPENSNIYKCVSSCIEDHGEKSHYDDIRGECVCKDGYQLRNSICRMTCGKYDANETYDHVSDKCVCMENYVKDSKGKCRDYCELAEENSLYNLTQKKCVCATRDYVLEGTKCIHICTKAANAIPNPNLFGSCICNWDSIVTFGCFKCNVSYANSERDGSENKCRCSRGYKNTSTNSTLVCTRCQTADTNSEPGDQHGCKCKQGFELSTSTNKCQDSCRKRDLLSYWGTAERRCVCGIGRENSTGKCQDKCRLEPFTASDGSGGCSCQSKTVRFNGLCETCSVGLKFGVPDPYGGYCNCQNDYGSNLFSGFCIKCDSLANYEWRVNGDCACKPGFTSSRKGICTPNCLSQIANSRFDDQKKECVCSEGFTNNSNSCVPKCSLIPGSTLDGKGDCKCAYGFGMVNGKCTKCSDILENYEWVNDNKCDCKKGLKYSQVTGKCQDDCKAIDSNSFYDFEKNKCECSKGYENSTGTCKDACFVADINSVMKGDSCQCINTFGYDKTKMICVLCSTLGASWIHTATGNCTCINNYYLTESNTCALCSSQDKNTIGDNKGGCICVNNYYRQKSQNECKLCSSKDIGLIGDNKGGCVCKPNIYTDYKDGICKACTAIDINSIQDKANDQCICKVKFFNDTTNTGKCQNCTYFDINKIANSDNTACVCANNYVEVDGKCKLCSVQIPNSQGNKAGGCACINNYINQTNICQLCSTVYTDSVGNGAGGCRCRNGFGNNTGTCLKCDKTKGNSYSDNLGNCVCQKGYINPPNCVLDWNE